jgi:type II secretory pathway component PulF
MATLHVFLLIFPLRLMTACAMGVMNSDYAQCVPYLINKIILFGGLYGAIFLFLYAGQANRAESWRAAVESVFNLVPVLRKAVRCLALARLACALEALTNAGVPVIRSWELAAAACGSPLLKQALLRWTPQLETGTTPAEMISQISYFPEIFNNLYHSGEISGKLDETLGRLHNYMEEEGFRALQLFTRILNGTIYGLVVLLVAYNIIGFYLDRFKAINAGLNF